MWMSLPSNAEAIFGFLSYSRTDASSAVVWVRRANASMDANLLTLHIEDSRTITKQFSHCHMPNVATGIY